jgi:transcription-repair coupling factor (superfamily II helicase)
MWIKVAFLAPTRVLALQHLRTIQNRMPDVKYGFISN